VVEWPTGELARRAGISPRTLRHYDQIGLLTPTRTSGSGLRFYDAWAVARLQRILLLRETGMSLAGIAELLDGETEGQEDEALEEQIRRLHRERDALDRKIRAVEHLLEARHEGRAPKPDVLLDGFNDLYEEEVVAHWGREVYQAGHDWWHGKTLAQQQAWKKRSERLVADWVRAQRAGATLDSPEVRRLVDRHVAWLGEIPGTPTHTGDRESSSAMIRGLAHMYVQDPAMRHAFGGRVGAEFVRDALLLHIDEEQE